MAVCTPEVGTIVMGVLLFMGISTFLGLFVVNNDGAVILRSPPALGMVVIALVADLYLLRTLVRDWIQKHRPDGRP